MPVQRRLAAILAADVAGYSRLMGEDEEGTLTTLTAHVFTDLPVFGLEEIYPGVVPDLVHEPTVHLFYGSKTVAVKDGLPKFKDLPADFGGSGDMLPE